MIQFFRKFLRRLFRYETGPSMAVPLIKRGPATRVVFFYPGEEGTFVDDVYVRLYANGIVHIQSGIEETTTHLQNCEIVWHYKVQAKTLEENRKPKFRVLNFPETTEKETSPEK